ncbi:MAG: hypothetical protein K9K66_06725 [Desulfarculaceae bacterium]|nr:hypothetical protein [Desulfarculaceae bacterium]MCF8071783.1 hypothetical protein [Desulfarculaceae bacterium]MCF8101333.1 hypothetical protein [Desulfarculaceae bacterium]MCF8117292.1 hypothetical protein [Desulfarculaceae bacterium]
METKPGDILLIHKENQPVVYARVEEILADVKPHWWQLRLLILHPPAQEATWILREEYIDGGEFTMGGDPLRLERLGPPQPAQPAPPEPAEEPGAKAEQDSGEKVVSLLDRRSRS